METKQYSKGLSWVGQCWMRKSNIGIHPIWQEAGQLGGGAYSPYTGLRRISELRVSVSVLDDM